MFYKLCSEFIMLSHDKIAILLGKICLGCRSILFFGNQARSTSANSAGEEKEPILGMTQTKVCLQIIAKSH